MQLGRWTALAVTLGVMIGVPNAGFAASFKVIHTFSGTDGGLPQGTLIIDKAGNLFGTVSGGGLYFGGTVFELSPDGNGNWTETILYNFHGNSDGGGPSAGVVMDSEGNLFGTTQQGGVRNGNCSVGCGVVFELSPGSSGWIYKRLYSFKGVPDGAFPDGELVSDSAGNLYGVTSGGGSIDGCFQGCGTVFELVKANGWQEQLLHTFPIWTFTDGQYPSGKLALDKRGNLYGTTLVGGSIGYGTIYEMTPSNGTWTENVIYSFCTLGDCEDGNQPSAGVIDINGQLYGTAAMGGGNGYYGTVFELKEFGAKWFEKSFALDITDGAKPLAPVINHGGALYGVTSQGGIQNTTCLADPTGNGVVFKLAIVNSVVEETVLYEFNGGSDGCEPIGGLVSDASGNLYGTTFLGGGTGNAGTVFEVTP